ncbi:MAG: hypothetical protein KC910_23570, partial [Candidatus Eremiobacteraeota bacterium]|nr:hypothetical protein [Candidatus Eremiobacteraeota bacterium]
VPRFFRTMPREYFQAHDRPTRLGHLKAIVAAEAAGLDEELTLRGHEGAVYTVISRRSYPGQLAELISRLPKDRPLTSARIHTASDSSLVLDVFEFGELQGARPGEGDWQELVDENKVDVAVNLNASLTTITITIGNAQSRSLFERVARHLGRQGADIQNAELTHFQGQACRLRLSVRGWGGEGADQLGRLHYLDDAVLALAYGRGLTFVQAEMLVALSRLVHLLDSEERRGITRDDLLEKLLSHPADPLNLVDRLLSGKDLAGARGPAAVAARIRANNLEQPQRQSLTLKVGGKPDLLFIHGRDFDGLRPVEAHGSPLVIGTHSEAHLELEWLTLEERARQRPGGAMILAPGADREACLGAFQRAAV